MKESLIMSDAQDINPIRRMRKERLIKEYLYKVTEMVKMTKARSPGFRAIIFSITPGCCYRLYKFLELT